MNMQEYNKVKGMSYLEYCDYLQDKYGIGKSDYFTKSWNKNSKVTRTKEGDLIVRYEREEKTPQSSSKIIRRSDDLYSFFLNEYRQNSPVRDQFGNIIISEDLMAKRFR